MHNELTDLTGKVKVNEGKVRNNEEKLQALESRVLELSRYKRRWNLRLNNLAETEGEDVRGQVIDICQSMAPDHRQKFPEVIDSVHRLGKKNASQPFSRSIIIQFTMRHFRDLIWKAAKKSDYLTTRKLRFKEDLSPEDRARRNQLWPCIEKARKDGIPAYFVGARAFIAGKEIKPVPGVG